MTTTLMKFFVEEIRKYLHLWDTKCRGYKDVTKRKNDWSKLRRLFNKEGRLMSIIHLCKKEDTAVYP